MNPSALVRHMGPWSAGRGSLHQKLAAALTHAIRQGVLGPGVRLPSERGLAQVLAVSRTTVVAAYDMLRESGWLESRTGSGTRVSRASAGVAAARSAMHAAALATSPLLNLLRDRHEDNTIDLALGAPLPLEGLPLEHFVVPPDELAALVRDHLYHPFGDVRLRQAVAEHYCELGLKTSARQILITNGAQHAVALCAALYVQRGDVAVVEDPTYFGALDALRAVGARLATVPVGPRGVSPSAVGDRIRATAARLVYLTPTFQNPTGSVMPSAARQEIAALVTTLGTPIIDDRTMADLVLEGTAPPPLAAYAPDAPILTIGSLSKLIWPGLRVGWVRATEPSVERLVRLKSANDLASPLLTQAIALRLMGALGRARTLRRQELRPRRDLLARLLKEQLPDWTFRVPTGGLFLWARVPAGDTRELAQVALRFGVVVLPGPSMSAADEQAAFLRLPFLAAPDTLREGIRRLAAAWRHYAAVRRDEPSPQLATV